MKISAVTDIVENFKSERKSCKMSLSKKLGHSALSMIWTSETGMSQTQEIKIFSAKNECNGVDFVVVTKFKFRYSILI